MKRIFIAINLPKEIKQKLTALQEELSQFVPKVKWTKEANLHLTLVFLGEIDIAKTQKIYQIAKEIVSDIKPFKLKLKSLGVFPEIRKAKIIWVDVLDDAILKNLNQALYRKLTTQGFVLDKREFTPHITIGRIKERTPYLKSALITLLNKHKETEFGSFLVESLELMESQLNEEGPEYRVLESIELKTTN